jgi:uncharacterized glyoxalase superfamily protein PhnB
MHIEPDLFFNGRCEEAIELYQRALGACSPRWPRAARCR